MRYLRITSTVGTGIWKITDEGLYRVNNDTDFMKEISYAGMSKWVYDPKKDTTVWDVITEEEVFLEII